MKRGHYFIPYFFYFLSCSYISLELKPSNYITILGLPAGYFLFVLFNLSFFLGLLLFFLIRGSLKERRQFLVTLFFTLHTFFLSNFPELDPIERWIQGSVMLLFCITLFWFCLEESTGLRKGGSFHKKDKEIAPFVGKPPV